MGLDDRLSQRLGRIVVYNCMSKLIGKSLKHKVTNQLCQTSEPQAYQQNRVVMDLLEMKGNLIGLLKSQSITVYDLEKGE